MQDLENSITSNSIIEKDSRNNPHFNLKNITITKKEILGLVQVQVPNIFINHLLTSFGISNKIKGEVIGKQIFLWKYSKKLVLFGPVYCFEFNANNKLKRISSKMNPVGKTFIFFFCVYVLIDYLHSLDFKNLHWSLPIQEAIVLTMIFIGSYAFLSFTIGKESKFQLVELLEFVKQNREN